MATEKKLVISQDTDIQGTLTLKGNVISNNLENGSGSNAIQQKADPSKVTNGKFDFTDKNPNSGIDGLQDFGATGAFASSFGGVGQAAGKRSHQEGTNTIAVGKYSHVEGDNSVALSDDSHAEGYMTTAKNTATHSEGSETIAAGAMSHAEGYQCIANGNCSHAGGNNTQANGDNSFTAGTGTIADYSGQCVVGEYNDVTNNTLFSVGNGTGDDPALRKTAFEVFRDGHAEIQSVGDADKSVASKGYVDNFANKEIALYLGNVVASGIGEYGASYLTLNLMNQPDTTAVLENPLAGLIKVNLTELKTQMSTLPDYLYIRKNVINSLQGVDLIQFSADNTGFLYDYYMDITSAKGPRVLAIEIGDVGFVYAPAIKVLYISMNAINPAIVWNRCNPDAEADDVGKIVTVTQSADGGMHYEYSNVLKTDVANNKAYYNNSEIASFDLIYPVGSIYMADHEDSSTASNPIKNGCLLPIGNWLRHQTTAAPFAWKRIDDAYREETVTISVRYNTNGIKDSEGNVRYPAIPTGSDKATLIGDVLEETIECKALHPDVIINPRYDAAEHLYQLLSFVINNDTGPTITHTIKYLTK